MARGQKLSSETQWAIIQMSHWLERDDIAMFLNLSTCTIRQVILDFRTHGTIPNQEEESAEKEHKNNRHLRDVDVEVGVEVVVLAQTY